MINELNVGVEIVEERLRSGLLEEMLRDVLEAFEHERSCIEKPTVSGATYIYRARHLLAELAHERRK